MYQFGRIEADTAVPHPAPAFAGRARSPAGFGVRTAAPRVEAGRSARLTGLCSSLGRHRLLRSAAALALLCSAGWVLVPGLATIPAASAATLTPAEARQASAFALAPLAYGGDTGRRMAPTAAVEAMLDSPGRPTLNLVATLGPGDGFARALARSGVAIADAGTAARLVAAAVPLDSIRPGTALSIQLGRRPTPAQERPLDTLVFRPRIDLALTLKRGPDGLTLVRTPIAVDARPVRIQGLVGDSLYRSARAAGAPAKAVEDYIRAIATQDGLDDLSAGDRFDLVVEHRRAATGETESGKLLYAGLARSEGKDLRLMPWTVGGKVQWFEASGVGKERGGLIQPVPGGVTSAFGLRVHPILHYLRMHRGLDFRASAGTPILAVTDGRVAAAGWAGGYGNQIRLDHGQGLVTSYSHMSRMAVEPGTIVRQGEVIGYVGSTGLSTGPHLHYEVYRNGTPVDPAGIRFASRAQLSGEALAAFRARLKTLLALPVGKASAKG